MSSEASPRPRAPRLLVIGAGPGDTRALDFCLGLPAQWLVTLFSPLPGADAGPLTGAPTTFHEVRRGVEPPGVTAAALLAEAGIEGDTALLGLALASVRNAGLRAELHRMAAEADMVLHFSPWSTEFCRDHGRPEVYLPAGLMLGAGLERLRGRDLGRGWEYLWTLESGLAQRAAVTLSPGPQEAQAFRLLYGLSAIEEEGPEALVARLPGLIGAGPAPQALLPVTIALNDYPLHDPRNGGAMRSQGLLGGLGRDVVAVTLGAVPRVVPLGPRLIELVLPRTQAQRLMGRSLHRIADAPLDDLLAAAHAAENPALATLLASIGPRMDAVVFEHPYMAPLLDGVRRGAGPVPVIHHAHNVEAALKADLLAGHPLAAPAVAFTERLERALAEAADLVICCSEADAAHFRTGDAAAEGRVLVVPHEAVMPEGGLPEGLASPPRHAPAPHRIGFLASAHPPNRTAARFIAEELAPAFPEAVFEIVGSVCATLPAALPANLLPHGVLPPARMRAVMAGWSVALNPVESGGGSSVKLAEYLSLGLPSISTPHAARGFPTEAEGVGLVVPLAGFAAALGRLLTEPERRASLAEAARRHRNRPERLHPLQTAREAVAALAAPHATPRAPRRLLVAEGAPSPVRSALTKAGVGALRPDFATIDVAGPGGAMPFAADRRQALSRARRPVVELEPLLQEAEAILAVYAPLLPLDIPPMAWTGFLPAEPGLAGRDTAGRFALLLPAGTTWVQLRLATPVLLEFRLSLRGIGGGWLGRLRAHQLHSGESLLELGIGELTIDRPALLVAEVVPAGSGEVAVGLRVLQFACGTAAGPVPLLADLSRDAMDRFRASFPEMWSRAARQAAARRATARLPLRKSAAEDVFSALSGKSPGYYDALLLPAEAVPSVRPALPSPPPRLLTLASDDPAPFGTLPESEGPGLEGTSFLAFSPSLAAVLQRMRALQEEAPLHRLAAGRRALGLRRPYLLAASMEGGPPLAGALHALTAPLGLDLVLAGGGRARRVSPEGEAQDGALSLGGLVCAEGAGCRGIWLPDEAADERALIALGWLAGVPVLASAANPFARQALRPPSNGLLLRGPGGDGLAALLRDPLLGKALIRGGAASLDAWLRGGREA